MLRVNQLIILIIFVLAASGGVAQNMNAKQVSDSLLQVPDSTHLSIVTDSITINSVIGDSTITVSLDSISGKTKKKLEKLEVKTFKPSPKKAVIYSAIFPGLGQIYNQKYWKLPIIYGGFVGVSYAVTWNNTHYQDYFGAYKDIIDGDPDTNRWHNLVPYGQDPDNIDVNWFTGVLKDRKNYFRYYRDLSIIIGVALYGLNIVDAYVDAQLFDFDISPDLSLRIEPEMMRRSDRSYYADSFGFKFSVSF